jgi:hypothetical protein
MLYNYFKEMWGEKYFWLLVFNFFMNMAIIMPELLTITTGIEFWIISSNKDFYR